MELGIGCKVILIKLPEGYHPTPQWPLWESEYGRVGIIIRMTELSNGMHAVVHWDTGVDTLCNITYLHGNPGTGNNKVDPNYAFLIQRAKRL